MYTLYGTYIYGIGKYIHPMVYLFCIQLPTLLVLSISDLPITPTIYMYVPHHMYLLALLSKSLSTKSHRKNQFN